MHTSRRARLAMPLAAITALSTVTMLAAATPVGAGSNAADAVALTPLAHTVTAWATTPLTPSGSLSLQAAARTALADPFSSFAPSRPAPVAPAIALDPALRSFPVSFGRAVVALEQAALQSRTLANQAFRNLTPVERATLLAHAQGTQHAATDAASQLRDAIATNDRAAVERARNSAAKAIEQSVNPSDGPLLTRVDTAALAQAARVLTDAARAVEPALHSFAIGSLAQPRSGASSAGSCRRPGPIYCDDNDVIEVWGPGDDTYSTDSVAMVRVDVGGNDTYHDHTGAAMGDTSNCDLNNPGAGCLTALLVKANVDVSGDDTYAVDMLGQGAGIAGVGVLFDGNGTDAYGCLAACQAIGLAGAGALVDAGTGNDAYGSLALSQGVGLVGAGVMGDAGGDDTYSTLAIGQGTAVVGGGMLADTAGNDTYRCLAICAGSALLGAGAVVDGAGNDSYSGFELLGFRIPGVVTLATNIGGGAAAVLDLAGNDVFETIDYGLGVAQSVNLVTAMTGMKQTDTYAIAFDASGADQYWSAGPTTFGIASGYAYARFWDDGALVDTYTSTNPNPRNNNSWVQSDGNTTWLAGHDLGQPTGMGQDS